MRFTQSNVAGFKPPAGKPDHVEFDESMPGFGIRFRNGGAGTFFVQFKVGSKHGRLSLGKVSKITLDAARVAARKAFAEVAQKANPSVERAKAVAKASETIEPLIPDFLKWLETSEKRNGGGKRSSSYLAENSRTLNVYLASLHRLPTAEIDRAAVAKALSKIRLERGPISADRSRAHLSKFFSWAIAEGLAQNNPVSGTNKTGGAARERVLLDSELSAIWQALGDDDYGQILRLLILTGCRRDEIGSLSRREVSFADKLIELPGSRTKSGRPHLVPLSPAAIAILESRDPREGSDFVFGRGEGGFSGWSQSKSRLDAKLDVAPWVLHDFRRYVSTTMHEGLGVPPHVVETILGHVGGHRAGVAGTYNRAQYLDQKREALEKFALHIKGLTTRAKLAVVK